MQETVRKHGRKEGDHERPIYASGSAHSLWFERVTSKLGLPLWLGIPAVTLAPAIGLWLLGSQVLLNDFTGVPIISLSLLILNILFLAGSSRIISLRAEKLRLYTKTLSPKQGPEALDQLYRLTPVVPVWALLLFASEFGFDPFIFKLSYSVYQVILRVIVTSYFRFAQATFLWVLGYSMYSISKWGKLPVRLKPFTDDPTLGLRPYGTTSLQFVTLYIIAIFLTFPVGVYVGRPVLISQSIFFLLGLGIFLGPLLGLRKKLMQAK
ncbi:MAG TPA: hypothetical protein VFE96_07835, partial [Candidatus Bathyarchaeia archaeon]|nr:hypothetical protein [Candidatus Bathyarchaeia archaeon]